MRLATEEEYLEIVMSFDERVFAVEPDHKVWITQQSNNHSFSFGKVGIFIEMPLTSFLIRRDNTRRHLQIKHFKELVKGNAREVYAPDGELIQVTYL